MAIPLLNDTEPSWADISLMIPVYGGPGFGTEDVAAVKWTDKVDVGVRKSPDGRKRVSTTGTYEPDGSITFFRSSYRRFQRSLAAAAVPYGGRISLVRFDVLIAHTPPGEPDIYKVALTGCRVLSRGGDYKEGTDPDQVEVPLFVSLIVDDGITL